MVNQEPHSAGVQPERGTVTTTRAMIKACVMIKIQVATIIVAIRTFPATGHG